MASGAGSTRHERVAPALGQRRRLSEEGRKNLIALVMAFGALVAMLAFAARPAAILPVGDGVLENPLKNEFGDGAVYGEEDRHDPACGRTEDGGFVCAITRSRDVLGAVSGMRREYEVEVGALGCWTAVERRSGARPDDGCITILDY